MSLLTAEELGHTFGREWLFRRVSFELEAGDRLVVTGRNGSGKSTLLRCLASLVTAREGKVGGEGRVGYSALDLAVYPQLTAVEHLELLQQTTVAKVKASEVLEKVGLEVSANKQAGKFSTGMRGRLKVAMALATDPDVLLLDEPTAAIDSEGRNFIDGLVAGFDGALVIATNDSTERRWATLELALD